MRCAPPPIRVQLALAFAVAAGIGCAGSGDEDPFTLTDDQLMFETGDFEVGTGDVFECFYTEVVTDRELAVQGSFGTQAPGGHHITVYYTTLAKEPQHHPCDDAEMAQWRLVGGSAGDAQEATQQLSLPERFAIRVPAGVQLVLQAHYINTGAPFTANDTAGLVLSDPADVDDYVNSFVVNDDTFSVPPHESYQRVQTCVVPRDLQVLKLLGHMHEYGTHYRLERLDDAGGDATMLIDEDWQPVYVSHPPILSFDVDDPLVLRAGTRLRQTCDWVNTSESPLLFPREMCLSFSFYYPDVGEIFCDPE
jgi:hypothetical protein